MPLLCQEYMLFFWLPLSIQPRLNTQQQGRAGGGATPGRAPVVVCWALAEYSMANRKIAYTLGRGWAYIFDTTYGSKKWKKLKNLKIQIRSAQNVGKVCISRKKISWSHLGPSKAIFSMDRKKCEKWSNFVYFPWWANGPYSPGLGSCADVWTCTHFHWQQMLIIDLLKKSSSTLEHSYSWHTLWGRDIHFLKLHM